MSQEFEGTGGHWDCSFYEMQVSYLFVRHPACERIPLLSIMIYPLHEGCIHLRSYKVFSFIDTKNKRLSITIIRVKTHLSHSSKKQMPPYQAISY